MLGFRTAYTEHEKPGSGAVCFTDNCAPNNVYENAGCHLFVEIDLGSTKEVRGVAVARMALPASDLRVKRVILKLYTEVPNNNSTDNSIHTDDSMTADFEYDSDDNEMPAIFRMSSFVDARYVRVYPKLWQSNTMAFRAGVVVTGTRASNLIDGKKVGESGRSHGGCVHVKGPAYGVAEKAWLKLDLGRVRDIRRMVVVPHRDTSANAEDCTRIENPPAANRKFSSVYSSNDPTVLSAYNMGAALDSTANMMGWAAKKDNSDPEKWQQIDLGRNETSSKLWPNNLYYRFC